MNIEQEVKNRMPASWRFAYVGPDHGSTVFVAPTCYELDALYSLARDLAHQLEQAEINSYKESANAGLL